MSAFSRGHRGPRPTAEILAPSSDTTRDLSIEDCVNQIFAFMEVVGASHKMQNSLHLKYTRVFEGDEVFGLRFRILKK